MKCTVQLSMRLRASWPATATSHCEGSRPGAQTPPYREAPAPPSLQRPASLSYCFKVRLTGGSVSFWKLPARQCGGRSSRCLAPAVNHTGRSYTACGPFLEDFKQHPWVSQRFTHKFSGSSKRSSRLAAAASPLPVFCRQQPLEGGLPRSPEFCPSTLSTHVLWLGRP